MDKRYPAFEQLGPGLRTGVKNDIFFLSEIGSGFGGPGGTPTQRIPRGIFPG